MTTTAKNSVKIVLNEKGIALAMILVLSAISLGIMAGLIYMVTGGTQMSGSEKRYKTAVEAGLGGNDMMYELIGARGDPIITGVNVVTPDACLTQKLNTQTTSVNWASCTSYAKASSITIDPADALTYDMTLSLGTAPMEYDVYAKIVDTVEGNTGGDEGLLNCGVVCANPGEVNVLKVPYLYTVEVSAENSTVSAERARLNVLYQY